MSHKGVLLSINLQFLISYHLGIYGILILMSQEFRYIFISSVGSEGNDIKILYTNWRRSIFSSSLIIAATH